MSDKAEQAEVLLPKPSDESSQRKASHISLSFLGRPRGTCRGCYEDLCILDGLRTPKPQGFKIPKEEYIRVEFDVDRTLADAWVKDLDPLIKDHALSKIEPRLIKMDKGPYTFVPVLSPNGVRYTLTAEEVYCAFLKVAKKAAKKGVEKGIERVTLHLKSEPIDMELPFDPKANPEVMGIITRVCNCGCDGIKYLAKGIDESNRVVVRRIFQTDTNAMTIAKHPSRPISMVSDEAVKKAGKRGIPAKVVKVVDKKPDPAPVTEAKRRVGGNVPLTGWWRHKPELIYVWAQGLYQTTSVPDLPKKMRDVIDEEIKGNGSDEEKLIRIKKRLVEIPVRSFPEGEKAKDFIESILKAYSKLEGMEIVEVPNDFIYTYERCVNQDKLVTDLKSATKPLDLKNYVPQPDDMLQILTGKKIQSAPIMPPDMEEFLGDFKPNQKTKVWLLQKWKESKDKIKKSLQKVDKKFWARVLGQLRMSKKENLNEIIQKENGLRKFDGLERIPIVHFVDKSLRLNSGARALLKGDETHLTWGAKIKLLEERKNVLQPQEAQKLNSRVSTKGGSGANKGPSNKVKKSSKKTQQVDRPGRSNRGRSKQQDGDNSGQNQGLAILKLLAKLIQ